jgi:PPOX class probable F420-dependent enzyme
MPAFDHIPDSHKDLLERPIVVALVTLMPDSQPQATPVWVDYAAPNVVVNTARMRQKDRNMKIGARVTMLAIDPNDPYRWMEVRGEVIERDEASGVEVITRLAKKYTGKDTYYGGITPIERRDQETRVTVTIRPMRVLTGG